MAQLTGAPEASTVICSRALGPRPLLLMAKSIFAVRPSTSATRWPTFSPPAMATNRWVAASAAPAKAKRAARRRGRTSIILKSYQLRQRSSGTSV